MLAPAPALFSGNPSGSAVFDALRLKLEEIGPFEIEEKKTSLHIKNQRAAFLGVHRRKAGLRLNVVLPTALESDRVVKSERVSANRWHNEIDVKDPSEVDGELLDWIRQAYTR
jgi:hypothetical protein